MNEYIRYAACCIPVVILMAACIYGALCNCGDVDNWYEQHQGVRRS